MIQDQRITARRPAARVQRVKHAVVAGDDKVMVIHDPAVPHHVPQPAAQRERGWPEPKDLDEVIRMTQQVQGEASQFWVEFYGNQPNCWGIFLWNLADSWPQMSDAYIAYPFAPKASLDYVKKAYAALKR